MLGVFGTAEHSGMSAFATPQHGPVIGAVARFTPYRSADANL
jgi:hypothetical protein